MTPAQYHLHAARTLSALPRRDVLIMAALGIGGESAEVLATITSDPANTHEHRIEEVGDLCWYMATLGDVLGADPLTLWTPGPDRPVLVTWYGAAVRIVTTAGIVVEAAKKHLYHGKPIDPIAPALYDLATVVHAAAGTLDTTLPEVWAANIQKLLKRRPPPEIVRDS